MKLQTKRLLIRPIKPEDKKEVFAYRSDAQTNQYQGWIPETPADVESFIARTAKQINETGSWFQFVIIIKESQKIIGDIGLHFFDIENQQVEIGFTLSKNYQNKGFASEAVTEVLSYAFKDLKKHRIMASIDPENIAAERLLKRIGFRKEAHFIESIFMNGKWVDDVVYAMNEKEWKEMYA